ncbi:MAG: alcohol dehydrogenase catalytic domain-containing protein, partial [Micromonosporaceae bacterium]
MTAVPATMRAWVVAEPGRLTQVTLPVPRPADDELLVRVVACGVCRTDLHVRDGDLPPHRSPVVPGHEVVARVVAIGADVPVTYTVGMRVGVPWLRRTDGTCTYCRRGQENLCPRSTYTGWDADGGYAEYL